MTTRPHPIGNVMAIVALLAGGMVLAACSQTPGFPSLPAGDVIGQETLTPAQQQAEIKDLNDAQVQNTAVAAGSESQPKYIPASVTPAE
jgi:hypothetical protein